MGEEYIMDKDSKKRDDLEPGKIERILDIYSCLCNGRVVNRAEKAREYKVNERSISRDIKDIQNFLNIYNSEHPEDTREVIYSRDKGGYEMLGTEEPLMSNSEILAVSKILLESRAFTKKELNSILDKLVECCVPLKNMKVVSDLILNEKYHYVELNHKEYIKDKLWDIGMDIQNHNLVSLRYARASAPRESIKRVVEPVAILFSEYYFYLNAFIVEKDKSGRYVHKYEYPAIFRIDRIKEYKSRREKFRVSYANRFEEGEFRKRVQFMYAGKLMSIKLKYYGDNPEPILDRLPTARVTEQYEQEYTIEAEVYGKGIMMWLLSQGNNVEVIRPQSLREEMKNSLLKMLKRYE